MLEVRHEPTAPTRTLRLASGDKIDAHRHDDHQIVYAGRGVLAVTTDQGSWVAPATRAIWIPAGTFHAHRAYGELKLHTVGLSAADNPLQLDSPTVLAVGPLLRELIIAYTGSDADTPERARLRAVLLDQLLISPQQPLHVPTPTVPLLRGIRVHADPRRQHEAAGRRTRLVAVPAAGVVAGVCLETSRSQASAVSRTARRGRPSRRSAGRASRG